MNAPSHGQECPRCGTAYAEPLQYCGECGATMDAAKPGATDSTAGLATDDTFPGRSNELAESDALADTAGTPENTPFRHGRRASDQARDPWLGQLVDNRYRVIEVVGRGGMGLVYKVEHTRMGKIAAMKVLHRELGMDPDALERFHREAEAVSRLTHPNTVQVFDFGTAHSSRYLIMEYVRGQNLGALVERDGPLSFTRAAPMLIQICAALGEAHERGVIHRDLKPENILVTRTHRGRDFVKVLDFGLAKLTEHKESAVSERGLIMGTPYYMSPEQVRGDDVDARTDIYSLGALMYRVLTGRQAFTAKTPMGVVTKHLTADLVLPSQRAPELSIPAVVDEIVATAMAKRPEDRFAGISELQDALEAAFFATSGSSSLKLSSLGLAGSEPAGPRSPALALHDDEVDYGMLSSVRLQRGDLDAFERSMRRRRAVRLALLPLLVAGGAAAAWALMMQPEKPRMSEKEPNNDLDRATLIAPGTAVTGHVGQRLSKTRADEDVFRVREGGAGLVAGAHVTGLPNMDLEMALLDATGKVLAVANEGGVGADERIRAVRILGPVYVRVTEAMGGVARLPTENVSDTYALTVTVEPAGDVSGTAPGAFELEPNEGLSDAVPFQPGAAVTGYLDRRQDVDSFRFAGASGRYQVSVDGAAEVPLTWTLNQEKTFANRQETVDLNAGDLIQLRRSDHDLAHDQPLPGMDSAYTLRVLPVSPAGEPGK